MGIFSPRPTGRPFQLFGPKHLSSLVFTGLGIAGTVALGRRLDEDGRRRGRQAIVAGLVGQEVVYHLWKARSGSWSVQEMLPLHLCSTLVWASGPILLRPTTLGDDVAWYWGMAGAPQALLTPDIGGFDFPHFRYTQFFISHGLILTVPFWQVFVEGRRPTAGGATRAFVLLLAQAGVAHLVNRRLGSNYMFVTRKPDTASVLDKLPPWPRYVPILAAAGVVVFAALRAPWTAVRAVDAARADRPRRRG